MNDVAPRRDARSDFAVCLKHVEASAVAAGLEWRSGTDFREFKEIQKSAGRMPQPPFNDDLNCFPSSDAFWIVGWRDGRAVHFQALRCDDVRSNLASHMRDWLLPLYRAAGIDLVPCPSGLVESPAGAAVKGRVVYHGEAWLEAGVGDSRGNLAGDLLWMGQVLAVRRWWPDVVYGLVTARKARQGFPVRCGYSHISPGMLIWRSAPPGDPVVEWIAWNSLADVVSRASMIARGSDLDSRAPNR